MSVQVQVELARGAQEIELPRSFIQRTLDFYVDEYVAIEKSYWNGVSLRSQVRPLAYPFTRPGHIDYVTASMATLYVSQGAYLATRFMITNGLVTCDPPLTDEHFFRARDAGELVFVNVELRFKRKIHIHEHKFIALSQAIKTLHRSRTHLFGHLTGDLAAGACRVDGTLAFPILASF